MFHTKRAFIPLTALLLVLLASPVMAAPKTKSLFESNVSLTAGNVSMGEQTTTQDGMLYVNDAISEGEITSNSGPAISGELWTILSGTGDLNTGQGSFQGEFKIINEIGTFEGRLTGSVRANFQEGTAQVTGSFLGFGTGGYAKQKIKGSFEGIVIFGVLEADLVMTGLLQSKDT